MLVYHFCRVQLPGIALSLPPFEDRLRGMFERAHGSKTPVSGWSEFLEKLQAVDAFVVAACLEGTEDAWQLLLFDARVGRQDKRLLDALRARAVKLYPGNEERQNSAVDDFWGHLLVSETPGSVPILKRYDGLRPLVPWLITIFQNWQISQLRGRDGKGVGLDVDDLLQERELPTEPAPHWHESFCEAARQWLGKVAEKEDLLLLGLLWRHRLSQRETAKLLAVHEGTISRRVKDLSDRCLSYVGDRLRAEGWAGDDLSGFLYSEMAGVLLDEPRLSADSLGRLLRERGKSLPG
jgi:hypothetical protein